MTEPIVADTDVYITRVFAAPREIVWRFFTDPDQVTRWFGPTGFSVPRDSVEIDLEPGGRWNLAMTDATGNRFPIRGTIVELVTEHLLVVRLDADTDAGAIGDVLLRVQLHDHGERTRITLHQGPFTPEQRTQTAEGWELSFQKIDTILEGEAA